MNGCACNPKAKAVWVRMQMRLARQSYVRRGEDIGMGGRGGKEGCYSQVPAHAGQRWIFLCGESFVEKMLQDARIRAQNAPRRRCSNTGTECSTEKTLEYGHRTW